MEATRKHALSQAPLNGTWEKVAGRKQLYLIAKVMWALHLRLPIRGALFDFLDWAGVIREGTRSRALTARFALVSPSSLDDFAFKVEKTE